MRIIDADALKEDFKARLEKAKNWKENALNRGDDEIVIRATATIDFIYEVIMTINYAPTVEIPNYGGQIVPDNLQGWKYEERPHGEWIKWNFKTFDALGDWEYKCSNCEKVYGGEYNFCPNCGADMRKGKGNE